LKNLSLRTEKINNEECIMKNLIRFSGLTVALTLLIGFMAACDTEPESDPKLGTPINVAITVEGRTMTVTWDAVSNAQGYEIFTTSVGCGSGNKIINTKDSNATNHTGTGDYLKNDKSNGAVEILEPTKIQITLMPATDNPAKPMATEVTAKVRALGGKSGEKNYLDSGYSTEANKPLGGMGGM
jgi:hypothetical protein